MRKILSPLVRRHYLETPAVPGGFSSTLAVLELTPAVPGVFSSTLAVLELTPAVPGVNS